MDKKPTLGYIGLGLMGKPMAEICSMLVIPWWCITAAGKLSRN